VYPSRVNRTLLLALVLIGFTLLGPLFVLAQTGGDWRAALKAWRESALYWAVLGVPGALVAAWMFIFGT
jgi:hypothetical protein